MESENKFEPKIAKVTINIGVGEAGERLEKAEKVIEMITGRKPIKTIAKRTNKELGVRKGMPIGCKVTLRKNKAEEFLKKALNIINNRIPSYSFDDDGNFSFGIPDYTLFPDQKYDPEIGIFGMDVCVTLERSGYRIKYRKIRKRKVPERHRVKREEAIEFVKKRLGVEVLE